MRKSRDALALCPLVVQLTRLTRYATAPVFRARQELELCHAQSWHVLQTVASVCRGMNARKGFRLRIGPCRALGTDTPRDAELRGDLAGRRLGSERKYVKRIYAQDTGKARRQFAC